MSRFILDILVDWFLPFVIIGICAGLLFTGKDSEVKAVFTLSAGWVFKSAYQHRRGGN